MNLHVLEHLDYGLYSDGERVQLTSKLLDDPKVQNNLDLENASIQKQLEGMANYILYGKHDDTEKSIVDKKEVFIKSKYSSFQKKEPESLDQLRESLHFNEAEIKPLDKKNSYTKPKQVISRTKDADIPGIDELWETIDQMQRIYDISTKKAEPTEEEILNGKILSGLALYKWRHWLIDVRRHQFYLKDSYKKQIKFINVAPTSTDYIDWENDSQYTLPDGTKKLVREHTIDFTNLDHIYHLLEFYGQIRQATYDDLNAPSRYLLDSLEEIIDKTNLPDSRMDILMMKVEKKTNLRIKEMLQLKYGLNYSENYISTIWKQEICKKIAAQADIEVDKYNCRNYAKAWKRCRCCGEYKLADEREFVKKNTTKDGLSTRCKECDKKDRELKKTTKK